jgi:hypothetical protein
MKLKSLAVLSAAAVLGGSFATGCARYTVSSAGGEIADPAEAAKTVVLNVENTNTSPMELRATLNGKSYFVGSVGGNDSANLLLEPTLFPTAVLYITAIPADGRGRATVGPLGASKGDKIKFIIRPALDLSSATVVR